jgi:hypothetical protein
LLLTSPHLTDLDLLHFGGENPLESVRSASMVASAWHLERLTVLDLEGSHLEDEGLTVLAGAWHLRSVRKLTLGSGHRISHHLGEAGLAALADSIAFTGLTHLSLHDCEIFDRGLRQLLRWPGSEGLLELDLAFTATSGEGMTELAQCPRFKSLRRLSLSASSLNDEALAALAEAPWFPHLRQLWIAAWESYGDEEEQTEDAFKAFSARCGSRLILSPWTEAGFELSAVGEADRIWHRLRCCRYRDKTGLNLACIL